MKNNRADAVGIPGAPSASAGPGAEAVLRNAAAINTIGALPDARLARACPTYYFTFFDFNIDAVLNMLATSS